jgi:hypothetical protein
MSSNQIQFGITFTTDDLDSVMGHIREVSDETTQSISAGWTQANSTAIDGLKNLATQSEQTSSRTKEQIEKASNAASILGDLVGVSIPDGLQKMLAGSEVAGPALEAALEPLAAIALAQAIVQVIFKVQDLIDSWKNLSEEEKVAIDGAASDARRAVDFGHQIIAIRREAALVGKSEVEQARLRAQFAAEDEKEEEGYLKRARKRYEAAKQIVDLEGVTRKGDTQHNDPYYTNPRTGIRSYPDVPLVSDDQLKKAKADIRQLEDLYGTGLQDLERATFASAEKRALAEKQAQQAVLETQAKQVQVISVQTQQNRIDTSRLASQEVVADYEKSFTEINAATQQFNNQQLSILMTGINKTSTQVVLANQNTSKKIEADEAASLSRRQKLWDQTFKGITGAFDTFINGILSGHQKLSQAWEKLVDSMVSKFVEGLEKQLMSFIQHKLMELTIHTSTEQAKDEASKAAHAKEDERTAYSAAKGAWESVVHTPIVGPILAPIAAATTFAAVSAFGSAEGGQYVVPSEQLTMLHRNEMVLPAGVAARMRGVIEGGGGVGTTVVVNHSVSAVDAESFQSHIRRHANLIGIEVARVLKKKSSRFE